MTTLVRLRHTTCYRYDRPVTLGPHEIRLKPVAGCRTPIASYTLAVRPERHTQYGYDDHAGNSVVRVLFPERISAFDIDVALTADLAAINPFDFLIYPAAARIPIAYSGAERRELAPLLDTSDGGDPTARWVADFQRREQPDGRDTLDFLVRVNQRLQQGIAYLTRAEHGVQSCAETLERGSGSCRDSSWLLVQILRRFGIAARFVSGYLVQLAGRAEDSPETDSADLHAWAEAYLPGAGWVGFDPTSGLLAAECHIPLARAGEPALAAPVTGTVEPCRSQMNHSLSVERLP